MKEERNKSHHKICFAASTGGHFEQLLMLKPLMARYDSFILTEKTTYDTKITGTSQYFLPQINRKEILFPLKMIYILLKSGLIFIKERPDIVITTGVLAMIPMALICKLSGGHLIYIESFAKVTSPTKTGKFLYRFADRFYVQWESMLKIYPDAVFMGSIY